MDEVKYCRVCLVTDVKMFTLETTSSDSIGAVYSHLAQIPIIDPNQYVCFECASLLQKYQEFKSKCLRAHNVLSRIKLNSLQITVQVIKSIDRKLNKLESTLKSSTTTVFHGGYSIDIDAEIIKTEDKENEQIKNDIKIEEPIDTETDEKYDFLEYQNGEDFIDSEEYTVTMKTPRPKHKNKLNKEPKTKKRKLKLPTTKNVIIGKDNNSSDDEPLSKSVVNITKTVDKASLPKSTRQRKDSLDFTYFEDYADVEFLTPEDARKEMLLRKESSNYKLSSFKCDLCYRGYGAEAAFENHKKKHSIEWGDYECELCHLRFPKQVHLCKHNLQCHKRKFSCKLCSYVCYGTYQAKNHVSLHKGKTYPCKYCDEVFTVPNSLIMHKRIKHMKECMREIVCEICGDIFGTQRGLFLHNMKVHALDKNEKLGPNCEDCGVHFASEMAWKRHLVISTKHKVSNGCKFCGETFSNESDLKIHSRVHARRTGSSGCFNIKLPGKCLMCDKWLTKRAEYKAHMKSEHPHSNEAKQLVVEDQTPFVCEVCGQAFKTPCFLTYHQRKHTGERPYKCSECDKTFRLAGELSLHRNTHSRARNYKCEMCARVFTFQSALNKHMKIHLNIRPHKCAVCDKGFIHLCDLKLHIKYVHDKVPWPKKKKKTNIVDDASYLDYN